MKSQVKVTKTATTKMTIELTAKDILDLLGYKKGSVEFHIPGGGDWSNCSFDIDSDNPIVVTWTETETEED